MSWSLDGSPVRSVLLTRLRYLGDVAMTTVVAEVLRAGDPGLRIGYLCEASHGAILADHPHLDRVHLLESARRGADARARIRQDAAVGESRPRGTLGMVAELRSARYDLAVDMFFNPRSAWLLWLAGIPRRIGGTRRSRRHLYTHTILRGDLPAEPLASLAPGGLGEHLCRVAPLVHVESGLDLLTWAAAAFPAGTLRPRVARPAGVGDIPCGPAAPWVLAPAATWPTKEWPATHWRALLEAWTAEPGPPLAVLVPPGREGDWASLAAGMPPGRLTVLPPRGLAGVRELLAGARGLVSADGGIMHLGVALGIPTLGLFGPTDADIWFPYAGMGPYRVLATKPPCHPCGLHTCDAFICLPDLEPRVVLAAAREMLAAAEERRR